MGGAGGDGHPKQVELYCLYVSQILKILYICGGARLLVSSVVTCTLAVLYIVVLKILYLNRCLSFMCLCIAAATWQIKFIHDVKLSFL